MVPLVSVLTGLDRNNPYLPLEVFMAQRLVGPSKQLNQIIQIEHSIVKNPNWPATNQLAIYKRDRGATEKQLQVVVRAELEPATSAKSGVVTTRPRCLLLLV